MGDELKNGSIGVIDTHCHIHDREFFGEVQQDEFLKAAQRKGVEAVVTIGTDVEDSLAAKKFAEKYAVMKNDVEGADEEFPEVFWTFGIHPEMAKSEKEAREMVEKANEKVAECFNENETKKLGLKPVAIGEIGLDYHDGERFRKAQIGLFEGMLDLAVRYDLPVSFHVRKAFDDFFPVVANFPKVRGIVHCFTDSKKNLRRILEQTDFLVAVNGLATYSTLSTPPLERTVLETDAPFLAPRDHRGQINQPAYVAEVAEWLAEKLGEPLEKVRKETTENARRIFGF